MTPEERSAQLAAMAPRQDAPLSELQEWMTALIGHDKAIDKNEALTRAAQEHFSGNERLSPAEQINIYRVQFWLRHTGVLVEHYDGLSRWLGQNRWQPIVENYLMRPEASVLALADLGHRMAEHIAALPPFFDQDLCVDLARLEWAYQCAFSAADDPKLTEEKLRKIPADAWADATFVVSDSLHLLEMSYPVADLRRRLRSDPSSVDRRNLPERKSIRLVVYRRDRALFDKELSTPAFLLLRQLERGERLIPACEAVIRRCPDAERVFSEQLSSWFALWGRLGWITDVRVAQTQNMSNG